MKNNKNEVQIFGVIMDIQPGTFFKDGEKLLCWNKAYQWKRIFASSSNTRKNGRKLENWRTHLY